MEMKGIGFGMVLGIAVGAVAVMMLPKQCPVRKFANRTARTVEDTMEQVATKVADELDL